MVIIQVMVPTTVVMYLCLTALHQIQAMASVVLAVVVLAVVAPAVVGVIVVTVMAEAMVATAAVVTAVVLHVAVDAEVVINEGIPDQIISRRITFVCREREFYQKDGFGFWCKRSYGLGIIGKPTKQLKYFMFGFTFFDIQIWLDFKWVGNRKDKEVLEIKEDTEFII